MICNSSYTIKDAKIIRKYKKINIIYLYIINFLIMIKYLIAFVVIFIIVDMPLYYFWQTNSLDFPSFNYDLIRVSASAILA
jgi:hypothetical protein